MTQFFDILDAFLRYSAGRSSSGSVNQFRPERVLILNRIAPDEHRLYALGEFVPIFELAPEQFKPYEARSVKFKAAEGVRGAEGADGTQAGASAARIAKAIGGGRRT